MKWAEADRLADEYGWCKCKTTPSDIPECNIQKSFIDCPFCQKEMMDTHIHCPVCNKILGLG